MLMYRMLIVDDEAVIADGLYEVFQNMEMELDLCKAYSGTEAVGVMKQNRVDIVLTDIRMPDMDGIELMEYILREWPHCKIIFLTGYDVFDYAYQAMKSGVGIRYILKSEGYEKVIEAVRQTIEQLDQELRIIDLVKQSQERLNVLETLMQGEYVRHLIRGSRKGDDLKADFKKLNIPLDADKPFLVVLGVISLPDSASQHSYVARRETGLAIKFLSQSFFEDRLEHLGVLDRYNDLLWLIQARSSSPSELAEEPMIRRLVGMFELIGQACNDSLGVSITITITGRVIGWNELPSVYDQLRQLQNVRVGDGKRMVQVVQIDEFKENGTSYIRSPIENMELLSIHLESGRRKEFMEMFNEMKELALCGEGSSSTLIMEAYYSIATALLFYINRMQLHDQFQTKNLLFFDYHPSVPDAFRFLKETAESLFAFRRQGEKNRAEQAIEQVCRYIEANLDQDLSLTRLAQVIHFNPSYLSRMFKQEKGMNLSEYIENCRVRRAKELLKKSELKINEIGLMVGYDAPHSFTRFFKRMTGVTPLEYRDKAREADSL
jgi:two-component system response regulator YesN